MALATYSDLKSAVQSWQYGRADIATVVDDFIDLTEGDLNSGVRDPLTGEVVKLRTRNMETSGTLSPDTNGEATLPTDYLEFRQITSLDSPRRNLTLIAPSQAEELYGDRASDLPNHFSISGSTVRIHSVSTTNLTLLYYAKIPALSDSNTTNWLLTLKPNIYLDGCCYHASAWLRAEPEDEGKFLKRFIDGIRTLSDTDRGARWARAASMSSGQKP